MLSRQLNSRVTIQRKVTGRDTFGQPLITWENVGDAWANIRPMTGKEFVTAGKEVSETQASVRMRYRTDVVPSMRLISAGVVFDVVAVLPDATKHIYIDCACNIGATNG